MEENKKSPVVFVYAPGMMFVEPYLRRDLSDITLFVSDEVLSPYLDGAGYAVMLESCEIYRDSEGGMLDESAPLDTESEAYRRERDFLASVAAKDIPSVIFRIPNIIGTGMTGFPRELVNRIYRGVFWLLTDCESRLSTLHCVDVAKALQLSVDNSLTGVYNLSDGTDPTLAEFAEALSYRLGEKRIARLNPKWVKWILGKRTVERMNRTLTFSSTRFVRQTMGCFKPHAVCDYLRTHDYDSNSL